MSIPRRSRALRSPIGTLALAALAPLLVSGHSKPPSVLLITIDTLRPDRLACYGHPTNKTPAIDRLAHEGMMFERAYCDMPWTTGSMASVMTGRYSDEHGLREPSHKLSPTVTTMAQILQARGVQTGAVIGSFPLDSLYGLDRGFETYDDEFSAPLIVVPNAPTTRMGAELPEDMEAQAAFINEKLKNDWYRPDEDVTDTAIRWLDTTHDERPFFLWVHYFGPHEKLQGDRNFVEQESQIIDAYDGDVEATDRAVGRLLDHLRNLDLLDHVLVILHADHGQNLGEHDYVGHTLRLDEVAVRIPLIVRYPAAVPAGLRRHDVARNVDILPTVLDAWQTPTGRRPGRSLLPSPTDPLGLRVPETAQIAYFETFITRYSFVPLNIPGTGPVLGAMERRGVRTPEWKQLTDEMVAGCSRGEAAYRDPFGAWALQNPVVLDEDACRRIRTTEAYREADPERGLEPSGPPPVDVAMRLQAVIEAHRALRPVEGNTFTLTPEQEHKLRSLGYLQ
jgi:hypothetical protein